MNFLLAGIILLFLFGTILLGAWLLAKEDYFFSFSQQGAVKVVMRGDEASYYFGSISGFRIHPRTGAILSIADFEQLSDIDKKEWKTHPSVGPFRFVGIGAVFITPIWRILEYDFHWLKLVMPQGQTSYQMIARDEKSKVIFHRYPYPVMVGAAETGGDDKTTPEKKEVEGLPLDIELLATIELVNASKALFGSLPSGNWLTQVVNRVVTRTRHYVGNKGYMDVISEKEAGDKSAISAYIRDLNEGDDGIITLYGVKIVSIDILKIDIAGSRKEAIQAASTAEYEARRAAEALKVRTDGEAYQVERMGEARSKALTAVARGELDQIKALNAANDNARAIRVSGNLGDGNLNPLALGGNPSLLLGQTVPAPDKPKTEDQRDKNRRQGDKNK